MPLRPVSLVAFLYFLAVFAVVSIKCVGRHLELVPDGVLSADDGSIYTGHGRLMDSFRPVSPESKVAEFFTLTSRSPVLSSYLTVSGSLTAGM